MADTKLIIRILTDAKDAVKGVDEARSKFGGFNDTMKSLAAPAGIALGAVTALGAAAVSSASDLQQAMGGVDAVFGDSAGQIKEWSATASQSVGLAQSEYAGFASVIGAQLKNLGVPMTQVAGNTDQLIKLGADLAATYGGTTQQAVEALSSALRGEADPAEKYGLALNQTAVNAELAAQGLSGLTGPALTAAKAQAVMSLATEQAGGALGQFGRESDTVAGQQQRLNAQWEDAQAALGAGLLPILTPVIAALADMANWIGQNADWLAPLVGIVGAVAAAIIAYTAAQWALNAALAANPIGLLVMAVGALIAGFIALWNSNEEFRNSFITAWEAIVSFFQTVGDGIVSAWNAVVSWFQSAMSGIGSFFASVFAGIRSVAQSVAQFFQNAWNAAVAVVKAVFNAYRAAVIAVFNAIRTAVNAVANFFRSAFVNAVNAVKAVFNGLKGIVTGVFNGIKSAISGVVGFFDRIVSAVRNVISWIGRIKIPNIFGGLQSFFGGGASRSAPVMAAAPAGQFAAFAGRGLALAAPAAAAMGGGGGTVINVTGGLDSADTIARRIVSLLKSRDQRQRGVTVVRAAR